MTVIDAPTRPRQLDAALLERCRARAATYDAENRFFDEDFEELREAGYLLAAVPVERGGWGLSLAELSAQQRRLARHAPATALALTMHHYWVGMAADLDRLGDPAGGWMLDEIAAGHVYAAGHAEAGNDVPVVLSTTRAERVDGGYRVTGRKHFGSLSPVWTQLGIHALDADDPRGPMIVHAFVPRGTEGVTTVETWDTLGMRATQSHDTVLDGVFVPDDRVAAVVPAGDPTPAFVAFMTVWPLTLFGSVYIGIAERAFELAVESAGTKTAVSIPRGTFATHPFVQHQIAEMYLDLHAARATVDTLAADWTAGVDHGAEWGAIVPSAKWHAVESAQRVVGRAMDVVGGSSFFRRNELERLYRDVRAASFHPATDAYAHEIIAKAVLGTGPDEPRW
jgi:alkylation response protein AidB-like acyl-CoA dehydrogenase